MSIRTISAARPTPPPPAYVRCTSSSIDDDGNGYSEHALLPEYSETALFPYYNNNLKGPPSYCSTSSTTAPVDIESEADIDLESGRQPAAYNLRPSEHLQGVDDDRRSEVDRDFQRSLGERYSHRTSRPPQAHQAAGGRVRTVQDAQGRIIPRSNSHYISRFSRESWRLFKRLGEGALLGVVLLLYALGYLAFPVGAIVIVLAAAGKL